ncbi:hypothetical protein BDL97_14G039300 [Sphagnum fallax]|nr:hypothetical protein BDL97_14G039300 [Sphagnum fallax]KAH8941441.1 hypothetical protein BDL97_14G039300 [Sphagnum fallax]
MGMSSEVEALAARAQFMRESMGKSQSITDSMISILGSFDHRLSALETSMRPTQVRTHAYRKAHENIDNTLKAAESVLTQFDVSRQVENKVLKGPENDLGGFLAAVDQLQNNVEFFTLNSSLKASDGALNHARGLLNKGMTRLAEEFKALLAQHSKSVDPAHLRELLPNPTKQAASSPSGGGPPDGKTDLPHTPPLLVLPTLILPRVVPQLREMARRLVAAGYHQQCLKIYRDVRVSTLEQSLQKLGVEKLSKDDVQKMQWETLEGKIGKWIQYMSIAVKLLFAAERKLCDQIWYHLDPHREKCFADVTDSSVHMLLSFGEAIAKSKKSPEKLFVLLDMHETMHNLLPEIEVVFSGESAVGMREAAMGLIRRLAQTAKDTFGDFEDAVGKDATKTPVLDGTVHPLTSYVINYVKFLFDYQSTLNQLLGEGQQGKPNSQLAAATMRIMAVLQTNLDNKAKLYRDPALTHIFLMNNIHYMVRSVRRSEAKDLFGDDWVQRQRRIVQQHANTYQRAAWGKALGYLSGSAASSGGLGSSSDGSSISKSAIKERLKNFNLLFDELYQRQTQWTIPDNELREAVRLAVAEVLLPAYRSFVKRYSSILDTGKSNSKYVRYSPEDLDRMLSEFFEGKARVDHRR